jgi:hypothetical protein
MFLKMGWGVEIRLDEVARRRNAQFAARRAPSSSARIGVADLDAGPLLRLALKRGIDFGAEAAVAGASRSSREAPRSREPMDEITVAHRVVFGTMPDESGLLFWSNKRAHLDICTVMDEMASHRALPNPLELGDVRLTELAMARCNALDRRAPLAVIRKAYVRYQGRRPSFEEATSTFGAIVRDRIGPADVVFALASAARVQGRKVEGLGLVRVLKSLSWALRRLSGGAFTPLSFEPAALLRDAAYLDTLAGAARTVDDIRSIRERLVHPVAEAVT